MSDGLFEFSDDNSVAGFRLSRLELYNWGTFNKKVVVFPLHGKNALLTGDNGSGKSSLVDALTTLLVPTNKIIYNKAGGADRGERSLRTYTLGYYKAEKNDMGTTSKPIYLRKEGTTHTVILGVFYNQGYEQTVTVAQVYMQKDLVGQPNRFYVVADTDMNIVQDFSNFGSDITNLKKLLRKREKTEVFDSFTQYSASFRRRLGIKNEKALDLFNQTISLKSVGNLTSFVREHMLESFDAAGAIKNLINHFEDLNNAHEAILTAKKQIAELTPIVQNLDTYNAIHKKVADTLSCRESLRAYFAAIKKDLLEKRIEQDTLKIEKGSLKITSIKERLHSLNKDRDRIIQDIAENGGNKLDALLRELEQAENNKNRRLEVATKYDTYAKALDLPLLQGPNEFALNKSQLKKLIEDNKHEQTLLQNSKSEKEYAFKDLKKSHDELEKEILSLKSRKSNIDYHQVDIRNRLCKDLHVSPQNLPFAGELIAVREDETAWEGAIERVLRSFGMSLLVPEELYSKVLKWVDQTQLRGRLVYYKVEKLQKKTQAFCDSQMLISKILIKQDETYHDWLNDQIIQRFNFTCCKTLDSFKRARKAITQNGQIKGSQIRHEKDDRFNINDRSRFILGWTNTAKIATLLASKNELEKQMQDIANQLAQIETKLKSTESRHDNLLGLQNFSRFEDLDWQPIAQRVDQLTEQISELNATSDKLAQLRLQRELLETKITETETQKDTLADDVSQLKGKLHNSQDLLQNEIEILSAELQPTSEVSIFLDSLKNKHLQNSTLYYERCNNLEQEIRKELQSTIDTDNRKVSNVTQKIIVAMKEFCAEYPSATRDFDASLEGEKEYRDFLDKLNKESLPQFEKQFKSRLTQNTIREIAGFQAQLNKECQLIEERVEQINLSMSAIEYNKDRYIKLELEKSTDVEIREFRQKLKTCIEGSLGIQESSYTEEKFLQVKKIISRFIGRDGSSDIDAKWTAKVTDVRNWFVFAASECWQADDTEYEHYTDSGGKSGGQKEKLAYTVLAASLAYQFGLEWGEVRSQSFRFVAIDEAFGRGSDESAHYGLELFKKLNLQLLIITPLQKIHIIEPYVSTVGFVYNENGKNSMLHCLTIEEYSAEKEKYHNEK